MTNDETSNDEEMRKSAARSSQLAWCTADFVLGHFRHSLFGILSSLVVRGSFKTHVGWLGSNEVSPQVAAFWGFTDPSCACVPVNLSHSYELALLLHRQGDLQLAQKRAKTSARMDSDHERIDLLLRDLDHARLASC